MGVIWLLLLAAAILAVLGTLGVLRSLSHPPRKTYSVAVARGLATEPAELNLVAREMNLRAADGSQTPAWIVQGDNPQGPTVVFVHGYSDSRYGALQWVHLVRAHASRIVLFDLPGHGESQRTHSTAGLTEHRDVLSVIEQIDDAGPVVLLGYSLGAGIAIVAGAHDEHGRIAGIIADGPYQLWDEPIKARMRMLRYPVWPFVPLAGLYLRWRHPQFSAFDRAAHARNLRCPLLILHGKDDPLCPLNAAQAIARAAPDAELIEFDDGRHLDLHRIDPDRYQAALQSFFARVAR